MGLTLVLMLILLHQVNSEIDEAVYISETNKPGLIFEHLYKIQFVKGDWQMIIFIDTEWEKNEILGLERLFHTARDKYFNGTSLQNRIFVIDRKLTEILNNYKYIDSKIRYIQGTVNETETRDWQQKIQLMKEEEIKILNFYQDNKLFVESSLTKKSEGEREQFEKVYEELRDLAMSGQRNKTLKWSTSELGSILTRINTLLTRYWIISHKMVDTVEAILQQRPCRHLLEINDLVMIKNNIEQYSNITFALQEEALSMENLLRVGQVKFRIVNRKIIVDIVAPLTRKGNYQLLKVQPFSAIQTNNFSLYIQPQGRYMLISSFGYYYFTDADLHKCQAFHEKLICPEEWFTFENKEACEYELYKNPDQVDYNKCRIIYQAGPSKTFWRSKSGNEWVYALTEPLEITIRRNKKITLTKLQGTGRLKILQQCQIEYNEMTFDIMPEKLMVAEFIIPNRSLKWEQIITIKDKENRLKGIHHALRGGAEFDLWETVERIETENEISRLSTNALIISLVLTGIALGKIIIVGAIITYLYYIDVKINQISEELQNDPSFYRIPEPSNQATMRTTAL